MSQVVITAGEVKLVAAFEESAAPRTCEVFRRLLPFVAQIVHVRWSGEAVWVPMGERELGLAPSSLFDTELAGRLLGYPRVGLATLVEEITGFRLRKEHSAVDWSTRPLPSPWLEYAAAQPLPVGLTGIFETKGLQEQSNGTCHQHQRDVAECPAQSVDVR